MLIIAMNRLVIMHDQRHIHVIMNIIVNPTNCSHLVGNAERRVCTLRTLLKVWQVGSREEVDWTD